MAVASDLPQIENRQVYRAAANSYLYDDHWHLIGHVRTARTTRSIDTLQADLAMDGRRDRLGRGSALLDRPRGRPPRDRAGGRRRRDRRLRAGRRRRSPSSSSRTRCPRRTTARSSRSCARRRSPTSSRAEWPKTEILTEYLNSIYFGNGAYGIESAARVYFGKEHGYNSTGPATGRCGDVRRQHPSADVRVGARSPTRRRCWPGWSPTRARSIPLLHPQAANRRRNLVLKDMLEQHYITRGAVRDGDSASRSRPRPLIQQPPGAGRGAVLHELAASADPRGDGTGPAWSPGQRRRVPRLLRRPQDPHDDRPRRCSRRPIRPSRRSCPPARASRARRWSRSTTRPDRSARWSADRSSTGRRTSASSRSTSPPRPSASPGSAFKPFTLAMALESGKYGPDSVIDSAPQDFIVPNSGGKEHLRVHNFGNTYSGPITPPGGHRRSRTTRCSRRSESTSAPRGSPLRPARRDPHAGLRQLRDDPRRAQDRGLAAGHGPRVRDVRRGRPEGLRPDARRPEPGPDRDRARSTARQVCPQKNIVDTPRVRAGASGPDRRGRPSDADRASCSPAPAPRPRSRASTSPARPARPPNYADAWFVGWTPQLTTAVWVGYPNKLVPMTTALQRGAGRGRHLPGDHLAQLHGPGAADPRQREPAPEDHDLDRRLTRPARPSRRRPDRARARAARRRRRRRRRTAARPAGTRPAAARPGPAAPTGDGGARRHAPARGGATGAGGGGGDRRGGGGGGTTGGRRRRALVAARGGTTGGRRRRRLGWRGPRRGG